MGDPEGRFVISASVSVALLAFLLLFAIDSENSPSAWWVFIPLVISVIYTISILRVPRNVGRENAIYNMSLRNRMMRWYVRRTGYTIAPCGCTYAEDSLYLPNKPDSEWIEPETRAHWVREDMGARLRFVRVKTGVKRCHRCGKHYHYMAKKRRWFSDQRECWLEDEWDVRAEIEYEYNEPVIDPVDT